MKTLFKLLLAAPMLLLPACNSDTADLHKIDPPNLKSELGEFDPGSVNVDGQPSQLVVPKLPQVGKVVSVTVTPPGELKDIDGAKLEDVKQMISITSDKQTPMLDLVFFVDDSKSMKPHQDKYFGEIDGFTAELDKLDLLKYQIGVATVYDSGRYFKPKNSVRGSDRYEQGITEFSRLQNGKRNFHRLGRLLPLADGSGKRFATPETSSKTLSDTLKVGAQDFIKYDMYGDKDHVGIDPLTQITAVLTEESVGPLNEEILAPMVAALNPAYLLTGSGANVAHFRAQYPATDSRDREETERWTPPASNIEVEWMKFASSFNKGFVRKDAHLGVIFLTDVVDTPVNIDAEKAAEALRLLKGDTNSYEKISTYGVLHKNTVSFGLQKSDSRKWATRHCTSDVDNAVRGIEGFDQAQALESFLNITRGPKKAVGANILNICSASYGEDLAAIAKDLFKKSVSLGKYEFEKFPSGDITVVYKNDPSKHVPVCGDSASEELCWKVEIKPPPNVSRLFLYNRADLGTQELIVNYKGIDLDSCTTLNCNMIGRQ